MSNIRRKEKRDGAFDSRNSEVLFIRLCDLDIV